MPTIDKAEHCRLCENQLIDYQKGTLCKLSNEKPRFDERCYEANFNQKLEDRIIDLNAKYEQLKKSNFTILLYSISFFILGLTVITGAYLLGTKSANLLLENGRGRIYLSIPIIIAAAGGLLIIKAISTSVNHFNKYAISKRAKLTLDHLLNTYSITYQLDLVFEKEIHGERRFNANINIINNEHVTRNP